MIRDLLANQLFMSIVMMLISLGVIAGVGVPICILAERKLSAFIQDRKGPNRVGPWGLLQPLADGVKFIFKEEIIPAAVDKPTFILAPAIAMVVSLLGFAIIPWAGEIHWSWMPEGRTVSTQVADLDVGFLYLLAVGSLAVYGVVLAGWSSNSKYSFFGGMRATAQMLSYEVPLGLGLLAALLVHGDLRLGPMVDEQATTGVWNIFVQPVAFLLVLVSAFAEANRAPFDLVECEQELVGGFHTEYSSMKFAMFFVGEYAHMITASALMVAMFFGGWHVWGGPGPEDTSIGAACIKFAIFWTKVALFIGFYMVIRWTIPRFRYDQLMRLAWKSLVPLGMGAVVVTGLLVTFGWQSWSAPVRVATALAANGLLLAAALATGANARTPVTGRQESLPPVPNESAGRPPRAGVKLT